MRERWRPSDGGSPTEFAASDAGTDADADGGMAAEGAESSRERDRGDR